VERPPERHAAFSDAFAAPCAFVGEQQFRDKSIHVGVQHVLGVVRIAEGASEGRQLEQRQREEAEKYSPQSSASSNRAMANPVFLPGAGCHVSFLLESLPEPRFAMPVRSGTMLRMGPDRGLQRREWPRPVARC
jgi:hypothetical protein